METSITNPEWIEHQIADFTPENFELALQGKIPALLFRNFMSSTQCKQIVQKIENHTLFSSYGHTESGLKKLGLCQMEYAETHGKQAYFDNISDAQKVMNEVFNQGTYNSFNAVMNLIREISGRQVSLAKEPNYGSYFAGTFRKVEGGGDLHFDYAPFETPGWSVDKVVQQMTWNIYLTTPQDGGSVTVHEKQWSKSALQYRINDGIFYRREVLHGSRSVTHHPHVGDLLLFNSRNFHEIEPVRQGHRFTQSSFIGLLNDNQLVFWS